jgi:hypothetical protein
MKLAPTSIVGDKKMVKHTPRPWTVEESDDGHEIRMASRSKTPGYYQPQHCVRWDHGLDWEDDAKQYAEAVANVHLMAAAPDLLNALKAVMADKTTLSTRVRGILEAAIKKADGVP